MTWIGLLSLFLLLFVYSRKNPVARNISISFLFGSIFLVLLCLLVLAMGWMEPVAEALFFIAPYTLLVVSVAIIYRSGERLIQRGWSRKYGILFGLSILLASVVFLVFMNRWFWNLPSLEIIDFLLDYFFIYLVLTFIGFVLWVISYRFVQPNTNQDYVIVLGAGLLPEGRVSRLLAYRLDEALLFWKKQQLYGEKPAQFILSGGQGPDEIQTEAKAMQHYLVERGMPPDQIILEEQSTNTHQNFLFSKFFVDPEASRGTIFITNNFHVLRSRLYAKQLGVHVDGIGAPTPLYYLPYALLREYIALFLIFRIVHLISASIFLLGALWLFWN